MNSKDPISFVPAADSRLGGGDIVISLTPEQSQKIGMDADRMADWFHSALWAMSVLRTVNPAERTVPSSSWHTMVNNVDKRLLPRLEGIRDALIRAYDTSGGSVNDLAMAMDVPRSTAQYRRDVLRRTAKSTWEDWAVLGAPQNGTDTPRGDSDGQ